MIKNSYGAKRIVCLTEETTEALYLMGEQDRIVGISGFTVRPANARKEKPKVSAFTSAKIDKILALKPDLVLAFSDMQADITAELVRAGLQVHVFNQRSVAEIFNMLHTLGALIGKPEKAAMLVEQYQKIQDFLTSQHYRSWSRSDKRHINKFPTRVFCIFMFSSSHAVKFQ